MASRAKQIVCGKHHLSYSRTVSLALLLAISFAPTASTSGAVVKYFQDGQEFAAGETLLKDIPSNIRTEWTRRLNKLRLISNRKGFRAPSVQESIIIRSGELPNVNYPTPVLRIAFEEQSFFDFNSAELRSDAIPTIDLVAELIRAEGPGSYTLIVGHTDAVGTDDVNDRLANLRATTVLQRLVSKGVGTQYLYTAAMGRRQPVAPNDTEAGRASNRRVEFFIAHTYAANKAALIALPVKPEWLNTGRTDGGTASPPNPEVPIENSEKKKIDGVLIRPPNAHSIRKDF
jgi:outer membrane protein OmpA-like peptidoglycan-associated protein